MHIQSINSKDTLSMRAGLYFSKSSNVLFNQNSAKQYTTNAVIKVSQEGRRYIEDSTVPQIIKDRFAKIPFINELAKKFDTFVHFYEIPKGGVCNQFENISYAKISWVDNTKESAEMREFGGTSPVSQDLATEKLFNNVEHCKFKEIA